EREDPSGDDHDDRDRHGDERDLAEREGHDERHDGQRDRLHDAPAAALRAHDERDFLVVAEEPDLLRPRPRYVEPERSALEPRRHDLRARSLHLRAERAQESASVDAHAAAEAQRQRSPEDHADPAPRIETMRMRRWYLAVARRAAQTDE